LRPSIGPKITMTSSSWTGSARSSSIFDSLTLLTVGVTLTSACSPWASVRWPSKPPSGLAVRSVAATRLPPLSGQPQSRQTLRERKVPSGTKTDRHDAWSLAEALRTDGQAWRALRAQDEATSTLRLLCGDEIALIEQRTALVNQLQAALGRLLSSGPGKL